MGVTRRCSPQFPLEASRGLKHRKVVEEQVKNNGCWATYVLVYHAIDNNTNEIYNKQYKK